MIILGKRIGLNLAGSGRVARESSTIRGAEWVAGIKIMVIGANAANVAEIQQVVVGAIGGGARIMTADITNYRTAPVADLYVCLINRKEEMEAVFGSDRVIALTLVPPTEYFLQLSKIPQDKKVVIFNNSTSGTKVLVDRIERYQLFNLNYTIVPYDEMTELEVEEKLSTADYIIGGVAYIATDSVLYAKFYEKVPKEAHILVSPPRIPTAQSISRLSHVYSSLYHKEVMEKLKRLSSMDSLTQLPNRRSFDEYIKREWKLARRKSEALSLAMLDIDFFKYYNDLNGHVAGDRCLKVISRVIQKKVKQHGGFFARYGGEEFVIVLPGCESTPAYRILEKVRETVAAQKLQNPFSPTAPVITISVGLTTVIPEGRMEVTELLARADQALYQAKQRGRNQCVFKLF